MLLRIKYDLTIKHEPGTEMLLADPMSRLNPLPYKELLIHQSVCLVQLSNKKLTVLRKDTSSDPELSALQEIYSGQPEK